MLYFVVKLNQKLVYLSFLLIFRNVQDNYIIRSINKAEPDIVMYKIEQNSKRCVYVYVCVEYFLMLILK